MQQPAQERQWKMPLAMIEGRSRGSTVRESWEEENGYKLTIGEQLANQNIVRPL